MKYAIKVSQLMVLRHSEIHRHPILITEMFRAWPRITRRSRTIRPKFSQCFHVIILGQEAYQSRPSCETGGNFTRQVKEGCHSLFASSSLSYRTLASTFLFSFFFVSLALLSLGLSFLHFPVIDLCTHHRVCPLSSSLTNYFTEHVCEDGRLKISQSFPFSYRN